MTTTYPLFVAGAWEDSMQALEVSSPYNGANVGTTFLASLEQREHAVRAAVAAFEVTRRMPAYERAGILERLEEGLRREHETLARLIAQEAGKPLKDARAEVDRAILTVRTSAAEALRLGGEVLPLDVAAVGRGRIGITRRFPIGPVLAIAPFNFPLNLALHKVAPAIAAGCPVVLKPSTKTPLVMLHVAGLLDEAGMPTGALSVLPMSREMGNGLVSDDRFAMMTFTGSSEVGWALKKLAGRKRVTLELGGNAGVIVDADADMDYAIKRIVVGGFAYAGQSCISVQRIHAHESIVEEFTARLTESVRQLRVGDPLDETTDVGPLIDRGAAERIEEWLYEATARGAHVRCGGTCEGQLMQPTVVDHVPTDTRLVRDEVFAPLVAVFPFSDFSDAVAGVNQSVYGLQAGVFTQHLEHAFHAFDELQVGGVVVNDIPSYRVDPMPYGGVKDSGQGREGPRYTIEEMTELKLLVLNRP